MAIDLGKLYPFVGKTLDLGGLSYHYLDEGSGDPVVMVHGNPSWSFYYRNLVLALRNRYRCIVPDHIGCGFSDKPGDDRYDYTLSRRVDDLEKLIDHLALTGKITLVVHDWGGMIGMAYASRHPERIGRLVILNTAAFHLPKEKKFPLGLKICRDTLLGTLLVRGFNAFSAGASIVGCKKNPMSAELQAAYRAPYDSWANRIATLRFVQDIPLTPEDRGYSLVSEVADGLERFADLPMAIFWGELDFVFDRSFLKEWMRRFPKAKVKSYPDAGHYILEDMKEEVVPLIEKFFAETECGTAKSPSSP
ncbi:alpha/beta fold hydrolase [Geomonas sp. Red32]|uniref:alpha/beta fold hydrolase n=1 Tax=Geomonas sp. Red32 TaxID=2912856 RepID=UPI00202CF62C|nr:alpha/beta fold hydrolase [Geomonas sp. Red32]MCM0081527.1 alpha/beta fold hydrolase [Geomonas sp. Red32]